MTAREKLAVSEIKETRNRKRKKVGLKKGEALDRESDVECDFYFFLFSRVLLEEQLVLEGPGEVVYIGNNRKRFFSIPLHVFSRRKTSSRFFGKREIKKHDREKERNKPFFALAEIPFLPVVIKAFISVGNEVENTADLSDFPPTNGLCKNHICVRGEVNLDCFQMARTC